MSANALRIQMSMLFEVGQYRYVYVESRNQGRDRCLSWERGSVTKRKAKNGEILFTREGTWNISFSLKRSAGLEGQRLMKDRCETGRPGVGIVACIRMRTLLNGD